MSCSISKCFLWWKSHYSKFLTLYLKLTISQWNYHTPFTKLHNVKITINDNDFNFHTHMAISTKPGRSPLHTTLSLLRKEMKGITHFQHFSLFEQHCIFLKQLNNTIFHCVLFLVIFHASLMYWLQRNEYKNNKYY